jgi:hypothetical protein
MKLNLKKIAELEKQYDGNNISLNALQEMINLVLYPQKDPTGWNNTSSYDFALSTLRDLEVIEEDKLTKKEVTQLNS